MDQEKAQNLIDSYLENRISDEDLTSLKKYYEDDPEMLEDIQFSKALVSSMKVNERNELRPEFIEMMNNVPKKESKERKLIKLFYPVAAAVILFIVSTFLFLNSDGFDNETIFTNYYQPLTALSNKRGTLNEESEAIRAYNIGKYQLAAISFEKIVQSNPGDYNSKMLLANCYLSIGEEDKTIEILEVLKKLNDPYVKQQSYWYLSLAYLKTDQLILCEENLNIIISANMPYKAKAKELIILINETK